MRTDVVVLKTPAFFFLFYYHSPRFDPVGVAGYLSLALDPRYS